MRQPTCLRIILLLFILPVLSSAQSGPMKILVFSKTAGFRHASIEDGQQALLRLGEQMGIQVDTTEDARFFNAAQLNSYGTVVFLNTTGDILNEAQEAAFEAYIQSGGGYMGIHAATDTEYDWPWYGRLAGAYFDGHPSGPNVREGKVTVIDHEHPSTANLPETWVKTDEFYDFKSYNEAVTPLIKVDEASYHWKKMGAFHPLSWYHEYDGGRAFYTNFGHTKASFTEPLMLEHLKGGLRYLLRMK
ncbi:MAG: ThuA domain-containing protein [Phaeodactylibacter sp.]|uniref:ThuA domain-containing protein n=1 Tax=Phaeodactylibacter sp. TaxID=1940289 RepID=UPI0032F08325